MSVEIQLHNWITDGKKNSNYHKYTIGIESEIGILLYLKGVTGL